MAFWIAGKWGIREVPGRRAGWRGFCRCVDPVLVGPPAFARQRVRRVPKRGAASVDYVLILAVILPLVLISITMSRQIMGLAYEFLCVLVAWPFM